MVVKVTPGDASLGLSDRDDDFLVEITSQFKTALVERDGNELGALFFMNFERDSKRELMLVSIDHIGIADRNPFKRGTDRCQDLVSRVWY